MLLDWLIKLKRSSPNCLFPKGYQNVSEWNILYVLPCSAILMFTTLLKNQIECIFLALLGC